MKKIKYKQYYTFAVLTISFLIAYYFFRTAVILPQGDDLWFKMVIEKSNLYDFLNMRYHAWTGRLPVEALLVTLVQKSARYWHILGALSIVGMGWGISKILINFFNKKGNNYASFLIYVISFTIPFIVWLFSDSQCPSSPQVLDQFCSVTSSGLYWYSGYFNYFLPITLLFLMIGLFIDIIESQKQQWGKVILIIILGFYTTSVEQTAAMWALFCLMHFITALMSEKKDFLKQIVKKPEFLIYVVTGMFTIFFLLAPGNKARLESEIITWMPAFKQFTIFDKLQLGAGYGFETLMTHMQWMFVIIFSIILLIMLIEKKKIGILLSLSGFVFSMLIVYITIWRIDTPWRLYYFSTVDGIHISWATKSIILICLLLFNLCVLLAIVFPKRKNNIILFSFFMLIFCSIIIGFSPTIYASGIRTQYLSYILLSFIFISVLLRLLFLLQERFVKQWKLFQ